MRPVIIMKTTVDVTIMHPAPRGIIADPAKVPRLGVLGGMFNPITRAHLALGRAALRDFSLGEVLYILPEVPPHKAFSGAGMDARLAMMRQALAPYDPFSAGVSRQGLFLDIARGLKPIYPPDTRIYFITGRDAAERILTWPYTDPAVALREMFDGFELIVANRGQAFVLPPDPRLRPYAGKIHPLTLPEDFNWHSSTLVRERRRCGLGIHDLVPDTVADYINTHGLYVG